MLSEEEKEAMKYFYNFRATIDESIMLFDEDVNVKCGKETIKQITLILNLIEKQQTEIEKKDKIINEMANALDIAQDRYEYMGKDRVIEYFTNKVGGNNE